MKIGTRSILFGCHQFLWHPLTVWRAWRFLYGRNPSWRETLAIICHDIGYIGCEDIDGPEGKLHPELGAHWAAHLGGFLQQYDWDLFFFTACHSRDWAKMHGLKVSPAYAADKYSIFYDPEWFYLFRVRLTGELAEFKQNAIRSGHLKPGATDREWFRFYRANVLARSEIQALLNK
jgi:hypothetical protein